MTALSGWLAAGASIADGVLVEPLAAVGYQRQAFAGEDLGGGSVAVNAGVTFGPATALWGPLTVVAMFSAATGGTMLYSASIADLSVTAGQFLSLPPGTYALSAGASAGSTVLTVNGVPLTFGGQPLRMQ